MRRLTIGNSNAACRYRAKFSHLSSVSTFSRAAEPARLEVGHDVLVHRRADDALQVVLRDVGRDARRDAPREGPRCKRPVWKSNFRAPSHRRDVET